MRRRSPLVALALLAGGAAAHVGCEPLPSWPDLEPVPGAAPVGAGGASGLAGTTGGATGGSAGSGAVGGGTAGTTAGASATAGTSGGAAGTTAGAGAAGAAAGASGTAGSGGAGAGGGAGGTSGSGGGAGAATDPVAEARAALVNLDNFVWRRPCKFSDHGNDVTVLSGCQAADICWETADLGRTFESKTIAIKGVAGHSYQFDLRLRGVLEPRDYPVAPNCARLPNMPADTVGVSQCQDGYANKAQVTFNVMELAIPSPARKFYVNSVPVHPPHRVDKADWKWNVTIAANQTVTYTFDDLNGGMIRNCTNSVPGADVLVTMQPFNGQWLQLNVDFSTVKVLPQ